MIKNGLLHFEVGLDTMMVFDVRERLLLLLILLSISLR